VLATGSSVAPAAEVFVHGEEGDGSGQGESEEGEEDGFWFHGNTPSFLTTDEHG